MTRWQPDVEEAVYRYASGAFPMDDADAVELPWYVAPQRAIFELDDASRAAVRRKVRRDVRACEDLVLRVDAAYDQVLELCAQPPQGDGVWITPRLAALYRRLHRAQVAHSFELWTPEGELTAGILGVVLGRAAMLESMRRTRPAAGNALLVRTLDHLVAVGVELCDIQLPTPHTERLGCVLIEQAEYEARLARALER
ncbi:Leucyl/phenylalanyl-tRNA--protein transferase [Paraconexibacter sp. AEG42_29]|uniref:Leucyl/phenylalanyl-tRNA--protein transferase n=1 Tax=Paraconexibacter sp. AEG42_29 TaxID=2997339 RepID=A0AAU7B2H1_9ACTN